MINFLTQQKFCFLNPNLGDLSHLQSSRDPWRMCAWLPLTTLYTCLVSIVTFFVTFTYFFCLFWPRPSSYLLFLDNWELMIHLIQLLLIILFFHVFQKLSGGVSRERSFSAEILQYHPDNETWSKAGQMIRSRALHAVSTLSLEDVRGCIIHRWLK